MNSKPYRIILSRAIIAASLLGISILQHAWAQTGAYTLTA
jgi:hypothetical protein